MKYARFLLFLLSFCVLKNIFACSIVGYIGSSQCKQFILNGLKVLEYRGYDSAGFACICADEISILKKKGKLQELRTSALQSEIDGTAGIGHTRWATHGKPTTANAHPHHDCHKHVAAVHNGIIENYAALKTELTEHGHVFRSDTDSEVIPHLLEHALSADNDLKETVKDVSNRLEGAFAFLALVKQHPDTIIAVRKGSPLCIGIGKDEIYCASDPLAFADKTNKVLFMPNKSFACITKDTVELYNFKGTALTPSFQTIDIKPEMLGKADHEHYMLKEIFEQKNAIKESVAHYESLGDGVWQQLGISQDEAKNIKNIALIGCGTSWHAARIAQFYFEVIAKIPTTIYLASEFRYMPFLPRKHTLFIAISQSGETADTLEAIRLINKHNMPVITITNVATSTMVRETNGYLQTIAGPEIAVASTKAFSTQMATMYWLANTIACQKGVISHEVRLLSCEELIHAADVLQESIEKYMLDIIQRYAKTYCFAERFMFLGRHTCYPFAMEAALKLKEISYIFAQGYPAGELKHGSIALIDLKTPVLVFSHTDEVIYQKLIANAQEVKARHGHLIVIAFEGQEELCQIADLAFVIPRVGPLLEPLAMAGLMQFFVYQIAKELGCDIDKPRNLAKSVTVE